MSRPHPIAVRRSVAAPARGERVAWCVLALLACVLAHETAYQLMYPGAAAYRAAMTVLGHDGYWVGLWVGVAVASAFLGALAVVQLRRLHREAATTPALAVTERTGPGSYLRLVAGTWVRLTLLAVLMFTIQENLEALAAGASFRGIDVALGHGLLPLLIILAASLVMSLVVALVRWRRRVLLGRCAAPAVAWDRAPASQRRPGESIAPASRRVAGFLTSRAPPHVGTSFAL